ncbi:MAG: peptidoglycan DD-metalloendopeptidase family protein [Rubrivivax sp.]|nr:peptidoglycan DD-metalloendopeptidase family protein [Rubrivivax sp.]
MSVYPKTIAATPLAGSRAGVRVAALLGTAWALAACTTANHRAPVEERQPPPRVGVSVAGTQATAPAPATEVPAPASAASAPGAAADAAKPLPGAENAGKPGYYTVRPGDTMIRIGLESGQNWRDIARWNGIDNPNVLEVGQVLRVVPPQAEAVSVRPVAPPNAVTGRPLEPRPGDAPVAPAGPVQPAPPATAGTTPPVPSAPAQTARDPEDGIVWSWPAAGPVVTPFDDVRSKGLAIAGRAGDAVLAAADGRVVYAGSGLRGYGNLVIVKHSANYLTAYAHNQALLVREDDAVRRGQRIAEMGSSDADRVQLHFEIRRQGKPIDPARLLPPR